jgi:hypothetical protein
MAGQKVLIVSPVSTHPPYRGNRQRILQIARLFRENGFAVELVLPRNREITEEAKDFWGTIHRLSHVPRWRPTKRNVPLDAWYKPGLGEELAQLVEATNSDIVLLNYVFHSKALEFLPGDVVKVIDTHDVFTARENLYSGKKYSRGFFSCSADTERHYLDRADIALAISDRDALSFEALGTTANIAHLPFVWQDNTAPRLDTPSKGNKQFGLVLSANDLNLASLWDFVSAVDTTYGKNVPFTVSVAGDIYRLAYQLFPHRYFAFKRPWLSFAGLETDIGAFFSQVDGAVIPVTAGSGMAIKFAEAIGHGVPTVSTAVGSRGHAVSHRLHNLDSNRELVVALGQLDDAALSELAVSGRQLHEKMGQRLAKNSSQLFADIEKLLARETTRG